MKEFKEKKIPPSTLHPHPHQHQNPHPNKKIISGVESEILIKYKRIKWTPSGKSSLIASLGDKDEMEFDCCT